MKKSLKSLLCYGLGIALTTLPLKARAEIAMENVIERAENKRMIAFTDLDKRDETLKNSYGHFLPFDRVNVTKEGRLIDLNKDVIDHIVKRSYPASSTESMQLDSLLSRHNDFYITGRNGSFRILIQEPNLVGTTDKEIRTSFADIGVNEAAGNYLGGIARNTDRIATEAYYLYNNISPLSVSVNLEGRKTTLLDDLPNRFGIAIGTNSSLSDIKTLVEEAGIYSALEDALSNIQNLGRHSKAILKISRNKKDSGNALNYEIVIRDDSKEFNQFQGTLTEDQFWKNHRMTRPTETVSDLETYLKISPLVVASAETYKKKSTEAPDTAEVVVPDTSTVEPIVIGPGIVEKEETKKEKVKPEKPFIVDFVLGAGYNPVRGIVGVQRSSGNFVCGIYGGISESGEDQSSVSQSNVSALGNRHEISRDWHEDRIGWFASGDLGYRINKEFSVVAGVDLGVDRLRLSGKASPRVYDKDGKVIGRTPDQVISERDLRKMLRPNVGAQYKGVSGKYSYDVKGKKHGVQVTFPIVRGGRNE